MLTISDLTPSFGAVVEGLDPGPSLATADERRLQQAFDERGLLVFRDLVALTPGYQNYLASTVIGLEDAAGEGEPDDDAAYFVSNRRAGGGAPFGRLLFHSDMMWAEEPFQVLTLFALEVAEPAVPTTFTSATAKWASLPDDVRHRVATLHAVHVTGQQRRGDEDDGDLLRPERERVQSATKPIGHRHARTGQTILCVSEMMTERVAELPDAASEELLGDLFRHLYDPATTYTHEWRNGDLVMWDNLAIQHARGNVSVDGPARTLRKVIAPRVVLAARPESPTFDTAR